MAKARIPVALAIASPLLASLLSGCSTYAQSGYNERAVGWNSGIYSYYSGAPHWDPWYGNSWYYQPYSPYYRYDPWGPPRVYVPGYWTRPPPIDWRDDEGDRRKPRRPRDWDQVPRNPRHHDGQSADTTSAKPAPPPVARPPVSRAPSPPARPRAAQRPTRPPDAQGPSSDRSFARPPGKRDKLDRRGRQSD